MPRGGYLAAFSQHIYPPEDYLNFKQEHIYYPANYSHHNAAAVSLLTAAHLQYLRYSEPLELTASSPLDLSLKSQVQGQITPPTTPSPKRKRSLSPENLSNDYITKYPPSPIPTNLSSIKTTATPPNPTKKIKTTCTIVPSTTPLKKSKAARKLNFDEDKSSPVSGTIIRELGPDETLVVRKGDIDPAYNVVEVTEEAKAELAKIENHIGEYVCRLCKELYEDAFQLAQHRCSRIVHVEYRCPECDKVFNCPANLASHRRWHKPRGVTSNTSSSSKTESSIENEENAPFSCIECGKKFRRQAYLRKHLTTHSPSISEFTKEIDNSDSN